MNKRNPFNQHRYNMEKSIYRRRLRVEEAQRLLIKNRKFLVPCINNNSLELILKREILKLKHSEDKNNKDILAKITHYQYLIERRTKRRDFKRTFNKYFGLGLVREYSLGQMSKEELKRNKVYINGKFR